MSTDREMWLEAEVNRLQEIVNCVQFAADWWAADPVRTVRSYNGVRQCGLDLQALLNG